MKPRQPLRIPKNVKIGPHTYHVNYEKHATRDMNACGATRHLQTTILIDPEQSASQLDDTFIHEVLHAINSQVRFVSTEHDAEEDAISRLAPALLRLFQDNPKIWNDG